MSKTSISIKEETKQSLDSIANKDDSYDDVLQLLLSISQDELEMIDEVYQRISDTDKEEYDRLDKI